MTRKEGSGQTHKGTDGIERIVYTANDKCRDPALRALLDDFDRVLKEKGHLRVNGNAASTRTQTLHRQLAHRFSRVLHQLGLKPQSIAALEERHIRAVLRVWWFGSAEHKLKAIAPKTFENNTSQLRTVLEMAGRKRLLGDEGWQEKYLPEVSPSEFRYAVVAQKSKGATANGIDIPGLLEKARAEDLRLHCMVLVALVFGLRHKEVLKLRPWECDQEFNLQIERGVGKGGKERFIPIDPRTPQGLTQRAALDYVKSVVKKGEHLGWPEAWHQRRPNYRWKGKESQRPPLIERNRKMLNRLLRHKLGISKELCNFTFHGFRAEYAENQLLIRGIVPATLGGGLDQERIESDLQKAEYYAQHALGHFDAHTSGAYYGALKSDTARRAKAHAAASRGEADFLGAIPVQDPQSGKLASLLVWFHSEGLQPQTIARAAGGGQDAAQAVRSYIHKRLSSAETIAKLQVGTDDPQPIELAEVKSRFPEAEADVRALVLKKIRGILGDSADANEQPTPYTP
jgi:integrase